MDARIQLYAQDRWAAEREHSKKIFEGMEVRDEDFFLDGPVSSQIAVVDFDPDTGELAEGAKFEPPGKKVFGRYVIAEQEKENWDSRALNQVCVFGSVLKTIKMFSDKKALGRPITWAFGAPQILVVPRAGEWANAFYERETHSLQFFYFTPLGTDRVVYTSQSRDIITHETTHAILDGIAPALYDAITPQSLALHEGFADLIATLSAFESKVTRLKVLAETGGKINRSTAFSALAEEFGRALYNTGLRGYLRNLYNQKTLDPNDTSLDDAGKPNRVTRTEPHELCCVLTGALYAVVVALHEEWIKTLAPGGDPQKEYSASGRALYESQDHFKRRLIRALDYLPVGEVSFADYGRAILATDRVAHPEEETNTLRDVLTQEFVKRKIVHSADALKLAFNAVEPAVKALNLSELVEYDWVAYQFVNNNRKLLHVPPDVNFSVAPRLVVTKGYAPYGENDVYRECLLKVSWYATEANHLGSTYPAGRKIQVGTTLAIDFDTKEIHSLLTSDHAGSAEGEEQCPDRTLFLNEMADQGLLVPAEKKGPDGKRLSSAIGFDRKDNSMRVLGAAKMLHITDVERR